MVNNLIKFNKIIDIMIKICLFPRQVINQVYQLVNKFKIRHILTTNL